MIEHSLASIWKQRLQQQRIALRLEFDSRADTAPLLRRLCRMVDGLLRDLWRETAVPQPVCLVAVGGYGRGELFPHSDIDLLILLPEQHATQFDAQLEKLVGLLWDIGLAVGHSVRTAQECLLEAAADVTVRTNLLEARYLAGDLVAFQTMQRQFAAALDASAFLHAKQREQEQMSH